MKARLIVLSCYLPRLLDHFGPVGPWAELLNTAVVNPRSKPRRAEKRDGLSRNRALLTWKQRGALRAPPSPLETVSFLPLVFLLLRFVPVFVFNQAFSGN